MEKAQKTLFDVEIELEGGMMLRYHDVKFLFAARDFTRIVGLPIEIYGLFTSANKFELEIRKS